MKSKFRFVPKRLVDYRPQRGKHTAGETMIRWMAKGDNHFLVCLNIEIASNERQPTKKFGTLHVGLTSF
jgi:hypothetical protein